MLTGPVVLVTPAVVVTVSLTGYVPIAAYAWLACTPTPVVPSPKFHEKLTMVVPSAIHDPDASNAHTSPSHPGNATAAIG
jgi:hypothetical protein